MSFKLDTLAVDYGSFRAVHPLTIEVQKGETLGLVGESGCGKSSLLRTLAFLQKPSEGKVLVNETDLSSLTSKELRSFRKKMQVVFQDPDSSLHPKKKCKTLLKEALTTHSLPCSQAILESLLDEVHLSPSILERYPFELSGGQKQRIAIARALSIQPELLLLDEPLSSLDMSIRMSILELLKEVQEKRQLTYLFVTHDLYTLRFIAHTIAVLYMGHLVEYGDAKAIYTKPLHPYTQLLFRSCPQLSKGAFSVPLATEWKQNNTGCPFAARCDKDSCTGEMPQLIEYEPNHFVSCLKTV